MRFELYKSSGKFRWRLVADNGEIIAQGQAYASKRKALQGSDLVRSAVDAPLLDLVPQSGGGPGPKSPVRKSGGGPGPK